MTLFRIFTLLFTLRVLFAVKQSDFGNVFTLLPSDNDWYKTVKNLTAGEIQEVVGIYIKPFKEYQTAARNREISSKQLKKAFVVAITLLQESARNFSLTSEEFQSAKDDADSYLIMSAAAFKLKKVEDLAPVFNVATIEAFSLQRLKHLIGLNDTSYISFLMRKNSYENILQEWNVIGSRLPKCDFRGLMAKNLDLAYVEHMTALYLNVMRLRGKRGASDKLPHGLRFLRKMRQDEVVKKIEALGNGYSTSKPPYSGFLIVVCTFYALLFTVMF